MGKESNWKFATSFICTLHHRSNYGKYDNELQFLCITLAIAFNAMQQG
jgi:hypothetical protein